MEIYFGSGKVFKGRWNQTTVALKVLMTVDGVTPSSMVRHDCVYDNTYGIDCSLSRSRSVTKSR
jgi:hypothetical protein